jgi:mono/diheme cytochrome c family protein
MENTVRGVMDMRNNKMNLFFAGLLVLGLTAPAWANEAQISQIIRGGRLYDDWMKETKQNAPSASHPAYPKDQAKADDPATNWRCVECHGWDYRGTDGSAATGRRFTGIKGLRGAAGKDIASVSKVLGDENHRYNSVLGKADIEALALFVTLGQIDMEAYIDTSSGKAKGDAKGSQALYQTICANCHGSDGQRLLLMPPLGDVARGNPWRAFHHMMNGHPGERMPALRAVPPQTLAGLLSYMQTLPTVEQLSSVVRGGRLYDDWAKELRIHAPSQPHPAYPLEKRIASKEPQRTWRCKECHGWDYKGKDGIYAAGPHATGIKGINGKTGADPLQILDILNDRNHYFGRVMAYRDLLDLSNFVAFGQVDMGRYIDADGKVKGNAQKSKAYYDSICATCHGKDGAHIITMPSLGRETTENPWNALHKTLNGHPGEYMPPARAFGTEMAVDILTYIQALPKDR